jgi:hypothetical protein
MSWLAKFFAKPAPKAPELRWDYTVHLVFDPKASTHRAVVLSFQDNKKKHIEKTTLEWLLMEVKHEIIRHQRGITASRSEGRVAHYHN